MVAPALRVKKKGDVSPENLRKVALSLLEAQPDAYFRKVCRIAADNFHITSPATVSRCLRALEIKKLLRRGSKKPGKPRMLIPDIGGIWRTVLLPPDPSPLVTRWSMKRPVVTLPAHVAELAELLKPKVSWSVLATEAKVEFAPYSLLKSESPSEPAYDRFIHKTTPAANQ